MERKFPKQGQVSAKHEEFEDGFNNFENISFRIAENI